MSAGALLAYLALAFLAGFAGGLTMRAVAGVLAAWRSRRGGPRAARKALEIRAGVREPEDMPVCGPLVPWATPVAREDALELLRLVR